MEWPEVTKDHSPGPESTCGARTKGRGSLRCFVEHKENVEELVHQVQRSAASGGF